MDPRQVTAAIWTGMLCVTLTVSAYVSKLVEDEGLKRIIILSGLAMFMWILWKSQNPDHGDFN